MSVDKHCTETAFSVSDVKQAAMMVLIIMSPPPRRVSPPPRRDIKR